MPIGQAESTPFHCPRCGSPMYKPAGGTFYWHAENNHPPCDITNIADTTESEEEVPASQDPTSRKGMSEHLS